MSTFSNKIILVTGGTSGIGQATAELFGKRGATVIIAARRQKEGEEIIQKIAQNGTNSLFIQTDFSDRQSIADLFETIKTKFGKLDFAFNNAGVISQAVPLHELDIETWDHMLAVNLTAVFLCMKYELSLMVEQQSGVIVNNSSVAGLIGSPMTGASYSASKFGVVGLSRTAAKEYVTQGIRVNAICPGFTTTPMVTDNFPNIDTLTEQMVPMKRAAAPKEIAAFVAWLCSDEASYVTGTAMPIDGGGLS
jgi:NAD(P)-dependent dehydrogenase (short-subunit alcohol dehydrogenase family)